MNDFDRRFKEMEERFKEMERIHSDIMSNGFKFETKSNIDFANGEKSANFSGSMSFYLDGKQYSIPYTVKDGKFNMKVGDLKAYLENNTTSKFSIKIKDLKGNEVVSYDKAEDLSDNEINYDLDKNENYIINILVTDKNDNVVVNIMQSL